MKRIYDAPVLELLAICPNMAISNEAPNPNDPFDNPEIESDATNSGELGWT